MQDIGGFEHRTTELVGALDVRWTSAQRGPKRSEDRIPTVQNGVVVFLKNLFNGKKREITPSKQYYKWTLANMHKKYSKICACLCTLKWDKMIL